MADIYNLTNPGQPPQDGDKVKIVYSDGKVVIKTYWTPPPESPPPLKLSVTVDKEVITANGVDTAKIDIEVTQGELPSDKKDGITFYFAIFKADGSQYGPLRSVTLLNGKATFNFTCTESSFYTFRMDKIYPKPESILINNAVITAIEGA